MNNFDHLALLREKIDEMEEGLRRLRDLVALETKPSINQAIGCLQAARNSIWFVDKALEKEYGG